jgi:hypothetical protein
MTLASPAFWCLLGMGLAASCDQRRHADTARNGYRLEGDGCRRALFRGATKQCDAVVVSVGKKPCELSVDLLRAFDGGESFFGSGCTEPSTLAGRMGKELFFFEGPDTEGFIVLCDDSKVDHIDDFAEAKVRCLFP